MIARKKKKKHIYVLVSLVGDGTKISVTGKMDFIGKLRDLQKHQYGTRRLTICYSIIT